MAWIRVIEEADAGAELTALYTSAMTGTPGLPKLEREMIALVVSRLNGCHY